MKTVRRAKRGQQRQNRTNVATSTLLAWSTWLRPLLPPAFEASGDCGRLRLCKRCFLGLCLHYDCPAEISAALARVPRALTRPI